MPKSKPHPFNLVVCHQGVMEGHFITTEFLSALKSPEFLLSPLNNKIWEVIRTHPKTDLYPMRGGLIVIDFDQKWIGQAIPHMAFEGFHTRTLPNPYFETAFRQGWISSASIYTREGWKSEPLSALGLDHLEDIQAELTNRDQRGQEGAFASPADPLKMVYTLEWQAEGWTVPFPPPDAHFLPVDTLMMLFKNLLEKGFQVEPWVPQWKEFVEKTDSDDVEFAEQKIEKYLVEHAQQTLQHVLPESSKKQVKKKI